MLCDDFDRNDFYLFALQMTGYSFTFWPAQITIGRRGQKLQTPKRLPHVTSKQKPTVLSDKQLYSFLECSRIIWGEDTHFVLGQGEPAVGAEGPAAQSSKLRTQQRHVVDRVIFAQTDDD